MNPHLFLFKPQVWIGEGTVSFPSSQDTTRFFTRWRVLDDSPEKIHCTQEVELHGIRQTNINKFEITDIIPGHFKISLENETIGKVAGKGIFDDKIVAWEIREKAGLEGYEVYTLQPTGEYLFRAEYATGNHIHTIIQGKIWKKNEHS